MQFVLGALLFFVVPKSKVPGFKRSLTPDTFSQAAVEMDNIPEGVGSEVFCIVFDAGSTGDICSSSTQQASITSCRVRDHRSPVLCSCQTHMLETRIP